MACDVNALLASVAPLGAQEGPVLDLILVALLCQLAETGIPAPPAPATSAQIYSGASPPAAPDDPTLAAIFYPDTTAPPGTNWLGWDIPTQAWL